MSDQEVKLCGDLYPKDPRGGFVCVKPKGHDGQHATLLGVHPEHEDESGQVWGSQEEWAEWAQ